MKLTDPRMDFAYGIGWRISFAIVDDFSKHEAQRICDTMKGKILRVIVKLFVETRSLTANAYFHALCGKMAAVLRTDIESVKKHLVNSYGVCAERDGHPVTITLPKGERADDYYPYCVWIGGDANGDTYALMKQTHVMDSREFARLLDATIDECRELNIEVLPDEEVKRLYAQIDHSNKHPERG